MKIAFIVSGLLGVFLWPAIMLAGIMLMDQPDVSPRTEILRQIAVCTALLPPAVWIVAVVLAIIESRRRKRVVFLRSYTIAPFAAAGMHFIALLALFTFAK